MFSGSKKENDPSLVQGENFLQENVVEPVQDNVVEPIKDQHQDMQKQNKPGYITSTLSWSVSLWAEIKIAFSEIVF